MQEKDLSFVIPIYRLREVGKTVEQYDDRFWRNGHSVPIVVFDDSSPANAGEGPCVRRRIFLHTLLTASGVTFTEAAG
jgi:hypothetical protein